MRGFDVNEGDVFELTFFESDDFAIENIQIDGDKVFYTDVHTAALYEFHGVGDAITAVGGFQAAIDAGFVQIDVI